MDGDRPPVPIKTYQWEDVRRSKRKGGYPWTHLTKGVLSDDMDAEEGNEKKPTAEGDDTEKPKPKKKIVKKVVKKVVKKKPATDEKKEEGESKEIPESSKLESNDEKPKEKTESQILPQEEPKPLKSTRHDDEGLSVDDWLSGSTEEKPEEKPEPLKDVRPDDEGLSVDDWLGGSSDDNPKPQPVKQTRPADEGLSVDDWLQGSAEAEKEEPKPLKALKSHDEEMSVDDWLGGTNEEEEKEVEKIFKVETKMETEDIKSESKSDKMEVQEESEKISQKAQSITTESDTSNAEQYLDKEDISKASTTDISTLQDKPSDAGTSKDDKKRKISSTSDITKSTLSLFQKMKNSKFKPPAFKVPKFKRLSLSKKPKMETRQSSLRKEEFTKIAIPSKRKSESPVYIHIPLNPTPEQLAHEQEEEQKKQVKAVEKRAKIVTPTETRKTLAAKEKHTGKIQALATRLKSMKKRSPTAQKKGSPKSVLKKTSPPQSKSSTLIRKPGDAPVEYIHIPLKPPEGGEWNEDEEGETKENKFNPTTLPPPSEINMAEDPNEKPALTRKFLKEQETKKEAKIVTVGKPLKYSFKKQVVIKPVVDTKHAKPDSKHSPVSPRRSGKKTPPVMIRSQSPGARKHHPKESHKKDKEKKEIHITLRSLKVDDEKSDENKTEETTENPEATEGEDIKKIEAEPKTPTEEKQEDAISDTDSTKSKDKKKNKISFAVFKKKTSPKAAKKNNGRKSPPKKSPPSTKKAIKKEEPEAKDDNKENEDTNQWLGSSDVTKDEGELSKDEPKEEKPTTEPGKNLKESTAAAGKKIKETAKETGKKIKETTVETSKKIKESTLETGKKIKEQTAESGKKIKDTTIKISKDIKEQASKATNTLKKSMRRKEKKTEDGQPIEIKKETEDKPEEVAAEKTEEESKDSKPEEKQEEGGLSGDGWDVEEEDVKVEQKEAEEPKLPEVTEEEPKKDAKPPLPAHKPEKKKKEKKKKERKMPVENRFKLQAQQLSDDIKILLKTKSKLKTQQAKEAKRPASKILRKGQKSSFRSISSKSSFRSTSGTRSRSRSARISTCSADDIDSEIPEPKKENIDVNVALKEAAKKLQKLTCTPEELAASAVEEQENVKFDTLWKEMQEDDKDLEKTKEKKDTSFNSLKKTKEFSKKSIRKIKDVIKPKEKEKKVVIKTEIEIKEIIPQDEKKEVVKETEEVPVTLETKEEPITVETKEEPVIEKTEETVTELEPEVEKAPRVKKLKKEDETKEGEKTKVKPPIPPKPDILKMKADDNHEYEPIAKVEEVEDTKKSKKEKAPEVPSKSNLKVKDSPKLEKKVSFKEKSRSQDSDTIKADESTEKTQGEVEKLISLPIDDNKWSNLR